MVEKDFEFLEDPHDIWKYKDIVISKVSMIDVAIEHGLSLESKETGAFTHRACCPIHVGKGPNGRERTPSMFFSQNSFCCFGCGRGGTVIDFISLVEGTPAGVVLKKLAKRIGLIDKDGNLDELQISGFDPQVYDPMKTIEPYIFDISVALREHIRKFIGTDLLQKELIWMEKVAKKADGFLSTIGHEDWEYAKDLRDKVLSAIKKREDK